MPRRMSARAFIGAERWRLFLEAHRTPAAVGAVAAGAAVFAGGALLGVGLAVEGGGTAEGD